MLGSIDQSGKRLKAGRGVNGGDHSLRAPVGASLDGPLPANQSGDFLLADS